MVLRLTTLRTANINPHIEHTSMKRFISPPNHGFTLAELMTALAVAGLISTLTATILIQNAKSNATAESRRRLLEDWNRATNLLQDEIAMSQSVLSENDDEPIRLSADGCEWLNSNGAVLKLQMHLPGTLPDVIYGIRSIASLEDEYPGQRNQWIGGPNAGVLIRCGPELLINSDGSTSYNQGGPYQQSVMADDLDMSVNHGLTISKDYNNNKLINFELALKGGLQKIKSEANRTIRLGSSGLSRINEVPPIPGEKSVCEKVCKEMGTACLGIVTTITADDPRDVIVQESLFGTKTYCTNRELRAQDRIRGFNNQNNYIVGNYVMDGSPTPGRQNNDNGIDLAGGEGRNVLLGTSLNDKIRGGPEHDALVGRGGSDVLEGLEGDDSIIPFSENSTETDVVEVDGGEGFDRVYMQENQSNYSTTNCNSSGCDIKVRLSGEGATANLSNVEQLIFKDKIVKISD